MTSAICMANARRSGKPEPHAATRSPAGTPMATPAMNTSTVAASAKTKASGSQRSATRVSASAIRCSRPSTRSLVSRAGRDVAALAEAPHDEARREEGDAGERAAPADDVGQKRRRRASEEHAGRHVADEGERHDDGEEVAEPATIEAERILRGLGAAVGERVHHFERFDGPEAHRRL